MTPSPGDRYGSVVAIWGVYAAVGVPDQERVDVFVKNGGTWAFLESVVQQISPGPANRFGAAVAMYGNSMVVGGPHRGASAGSAEVFVR